MSDIKTQTVMLAREVIIECPHCQEHQDGFFGNPAGGAFDCDDCGKKYRVHKEADIEHR
jgi:uncharacterized protein (DUF983 family)